jgi:hypothetical protein
VPNHFRLEHGGNADAAGAEGSHLMRDVRDAIPQTDPLAKAKFATLRERLIKIGARVIEHAARIRI